MDDEWMDGWMDSGGGGGGLLGLAGLFGLFLFQGVQNLVQLEGRFLKHFWR